MFERLRRRLLLLLMTRFTILYAACAMISREHFEDIVTLRYRCRHAMMPMFDAADCLRADAAAAFFRAMLHCRRMPPRRHAADAFAFHTP